MNRDFKLVRSIIKLPWNSSNFLWKGTNYQKQRQLRSTRLWFPLLTMYGRPHELVIVKVASCESCWPDYDSRLLTLKAQSAWERMLWSVPAIFIGTVVWPLCTADVDFLCRCRHAASNRQPSSYNLCSSAQLKQELREAATKNRSFSKTRHEVLNEWTYRGTTNKETTYLW